MTILVRSGVVAASRRYAMELVRPSSVVAAGAGSSASIVGLGSTDFSTCTAVSLNGVFSAEYDNYMISVRHAGNVSSSIEGRLRSAGTDATGTNYTRQYIFADNTSVTAARETSSTYFRAGATGESQRSGDVLYLYGPFLSQPTAIRNVSVYSFTSASILDTANTHSLSSSYDGITLVSISGNFTGNIAVYGLRG